MLLELGGGDSGRGEEREDDGLGGDEAEEEAELVDMRRGSRDEAVQVLEKLFPSRPHAWRTAAEMAE